MDEQAASAVETDIYIEASFETPFRAGWGAVIVFADGTTVELSDSIAGETKPRVLLLGSIAVLRSLPKDAPVAFRCCEEHLTRWTVPFLREMQADGFKAAKKKKKKNLDLIQELAEVAEHLPGVTGATIRKEEWSDHHFTADNLARAHGVGGISKRTAPLSRTKPVRVTTTITKPLSDTSPKLKSSVRPPWDDDIPF